jgi:hypothetical protein
LPCFVSFVRQHRSTYQRKPRENHADDVVQKLNVKHDLPYERMFAPPNLVKVHQRVHGREEAAVQPSAALRDEFGNLSRHVRLARRALDILQDPPALGL